MKEQDEQLDDLLQHGFRYAYSLTNRRNEAEDILQEACASIARRGGPWEKGYLFTSIKHAWIDQYRSDQRKPLAYVGEAGVLYERPVDDEDINKLEDAESMDHMLGMLKPEDRELLYLHVVEGFTASELAEQTNKSRNTILSRVHRAKQRIKDWHVSRKEKTA